MKKTDMPAKSVRFIDKFVKRIKAMPPGTCPVAMQLAFLTGSRCQTCGKCVPCRDGLLQVEKMLISILHGTADMSTLDRMVELAKIIHDTADCAIGYEAAYVVLSSVETFYEEYESHIKNQRCLDVFTQTVPCMTYCPAHVDIPGYIALIGEHKYEDSVNLIRQDNPFPTACAFVCEHPCENGCRRELIDSALNIRGLKKYAVNQCHADKAKIPTPLIDTGKRVAVIGGGPSGMTAAYYLALMGHKVTVFESRAALGGMLRYGIPNYRLPKDRLDEDMKAIIATGNVEIKCNTAVGKDISMEQISKDYNAVYIAIGAQKGNLVSGEGSDSKGVLSAVEMLGDIGDGKIPDFTGKRVVVVGGGNVAMDACRSAVRCGASEVTVVYRRRQIDMPALQSEIQGAIEEGVELLTMHAPLRIKADAKGNVASYVVQPQIISDYNSKGVPGVRNADKPEVEIPCDIVLMAIGQDIDLTGFENYSTDAKRKTFNTDEFGLVNGYTNVYAGGDCVTGPATAIKAIAAGKVAAIKIDECLGYHHTIPGNVTVPDPKENNRNHIGRVWLTERSAKERRCNFEPVENDMSTEEAMQECSKCLRCDHFGCGSMVGGRL